jgi:hypothetical protein
MEPGGIALIDDELWFLRPDGSVGIIEKGYQSIREAELGSGAFAFVLADLDGDQQDELLLTGWDVRVRWGSGAITTLWSSTERFVRDLAPADYDGDGDIDLLLAFSGPSREWEPFRAELLLNQGTGVFQEPLLIEGASELWGHGFDAMALDLSRDGTPDIYLCNDLASLYAPNLLLTTEKGIPGPSTQKGLDVIASCMSQSWGDINGDGALDVLLADALRIWLLQQEEDVFLDVTLAQGLPAESVFPMAWGTGLADLEDDGQLELILGLGGFRNQGSPSGKELVYRLKEGNWVEEGASLGMPQVAQGRSVLTADLNQDGALDLVFGDGWRAPYLLFSTGCFAGNWLEVAAPSGSLVEIEYAGKKQQALVTSDRGFASAGPSVARLGLGEAVVVDAVTIRLPNQDSIHIGGPFPVRTRLTWLNF